jgi:hypothetical protein
LVLAGSSQRGPRGFAAVGADIGQTGVHAHQDPPGRPCRLALSSLGFGCGVQSTCFQTPATANPLDGQAFLPAIAVTADGTIGVFYYDFRNNTPDPATLPTTAYLIRSHDGGQTWQENQLAAPFDLETAPQSEGYFIGDYEGLAARGNSFLAVFARTNTSADNRTDITAVTVSP